MMPGLCRLPARIPICWWTFSLCKSVYVRALPSPFQRWKEKKKTQNLNTHFPAPSAAGTWPRDLNAVSQWHPLSTLNLEGVTCRLRSKCKSLTVAQEGECGWRQGAQLTEAMAVVGSWCFLLSPAGAWVVGLPTNCVITQYPSQKSFFCLS